jgi:hypothetical protein
MKEEEKPDGETVEIIQLTQVYIRKTTTRHGNHDHVDAAVVAQDIKGNQYQLIYGDPVNNQWKGVSVGVI